jgi:hypothetical protein
MSEWGIQEWRPNTTVIHHRDYVNDGREPRPHSLEGQVPPAIPVVSDMWCERREMPHEMQRTLQNNFETSPFSDRAHVFFPDISSVMCVRGNHGVGEQAAEMLRDNGYDATYQRGTGFCFSPFETIGKVHIHNG